MVKRLHLLLAITLMLGSQLLGSQAASGDTAGAEIARSETTDPDHAGSARIDPTRASEFLAGLTSTERLNAIVQIELSSGASGPALALASEAEILWKVARYDEALAALATLERLGATVNLGIRWMIPVESGATIPGGNVQIGTRSTAESISLDWDKQSGNIFAVVDWGTSDGWGGYISTDGGSSWAESYLWCCGFELADMAVVDRYFYVAYTVGNEARLQRASVVDGQIDVGFDFQTVVDTSPSSPIAINLATNADDANDRIDYSILQADGTIRHLWADSSVATTFTESSPPVSNADSGLSTSRNIGWPTFTGDYFLVLSYVGTDDSIYLYRLGNSGWDAGITVERRNTPAEWTSVAAYRDTFLVAFEKELANGQGISYRISYDGGATWAGATLATPAVGENFQHPPLSGRSGTGTGALYQQETTPINVIHVQQRHNCAPGSWLSRSPFNDYDFQAGSDGFDCNWIGSGWGLVYVDAGGTAWFELSDAIFYADFEGEGLLGWSSSQSGPCELGTDSDGDRLDDCFETNTGVYLGATDTGTNPNNADTDGDSIKDGDEVLGTLGGLDLPGLGANPLRKDILVEYDWFADSLQCGAHTHRPTTEMINRITAAFDVAPVTNPDGSTGIHYIHDYGQGGPFVGGNQIDDADAVLVGGVSSSEFLNHKANNLAADRNGYFHYVILPHYHNTNSGSSGQAEVNGDDLIVSLRCSAFNTMWVSNTIAHELGHNLNLRHGGYENCNYKPNYNSVMSYKYQLNGVDSDCDTDNDGILDYSYGDRVTLNENNLNENLGVCGAPPVDWNGSGTIQTGVSHDVNSGGNSTCGGTLTTLQDSNDWGSLSFSGILDSDGIPTRAPLEIIDCTNPALTN